MRIYERYGFLVKMINITIKDMIPFTVFFLMFVLLFAILFLILKLGLDPEEYVQVDQLFGYFVMAFRNSIGDLTVPELSVWT